MPIWLQVVSRELLMLALLTALGSGPSALLSERFESWVRWTMAPVLGLALGAGLFTTLEWFFAGNQVQWIVPIACALSIAMTGFVHIRRIRSPAHLRKDSPPKSTHFFVSLAQVALVCIAVALPASVALCVNHSSGPVAYEVYDATGYIAETDALQVQSISTARDAGTAATTLVTRYLDNYASGIQELDFTPLSAAVNSLVGLHSTDTQSEFLIAVLLAGALAMFGSIRHTLRRASWAAVLGGVLFGGSFFVQLFFDGSEAAIAGLALLVPFLVVAFTDLPTARLGGLVVIALLLEGLFTLYPIFGVTLGIGIVCILVYLAVLLLKRRTWRLIEVAYFLGRMAAVVVLAVLFDLVAAHRDFAYWKSLLHGGFVSAGFPAMKLTVATVPGWLLQTRDLYSFAYSSQSSVTDFVPAIVVPIVIALFAIPALRRYRVTWVVLVVVPIALGIGGYQAVHNACGYCEDRSLLPVTPAVVYLVAVGIGLVAINGKRILRWLAIGSTGLLAAFAGMSATRSYDRFSTGSFFLTNSVRSTLAAAPNKRATVLLEGFGEGSNAPAEEAFAYELVYEQTGGHVSIAADVDDREGLAYLGLSPLEPPIFTPSYKYVLSVVPGISTHRLVIARAPGVALEKRSRSLDVSLDYGAAISLMPSGDPTGDAWVIGPLQLVVSGVNKKAIYVRATFALPSTNTVVPPQKGVAFSRSGTVLFACLATRADGAARVADITIPPTGSIRLIAMTASSQRCR